MPKNRAFTIIELLVVVAVIAILVTFLLPALRAFRRQAKTIRCLNNVQQCAHALELYLQDYRDHCPPWIYHDYCQPPHGNAWWTTIHYLLQEYADNPENCWHCPADDTNDCTPWDGRPHNGGDRYDGYRHRCSYFYNNGGGSSVHAAFEGLSVYRSNPDGTVLNYGKRLDDIRNPSKKITIACWCAHNFWPGAGPGRERLQWWHSDRPELKCPLSFLDMSARVVTIIPAQPETQQYRW